MKLRLLAALAVLAFVLGIFRVPILKAVSASYNQTIRIVNSSGTVLNGVASATSALYNQTVRVVDSSGHVIDAFSSGVSNPVTPAQGGAGLMTGAPMWMRNFGLGTDGAGPASGTISGERQYTTWNCTGAITVGTNTFKALIVRATISVSLGSGCTIDASNATAPGVGGYVGGTGGGSGGGAGAGTVGASNYLQGLSAAPINAGGAAGAVSGGNGVAGFTPDADQIRAFIWEGAIPSIFQFSSSQGGAYTLLYRCGGAGGSAGANTGGAGGNGGSCFVIIAPTITIASGATFRANGTSGAPATGNSTGAGSGGGGGAILMAAESLTDSGGNFFVGGGSGGSNVTPAIQITNAAGDSTGSGAFAHVSALSGGNPSTIVVDAGGTNYTVAPICTFVGGGGAGATCTCTINTGAVNACTYAGGGNGGYTLTTFSTSGLGGFGGNGWYQELLIQ